MLSVWLCHIHLCDIDNNWILLLLTSRALLTLSLDVGDKGTWGIPIPFTTWKALLGFVYHLCAKILCGFVYCVYCVDIVICISSQSWTQAWRLVSPTRRKTYILFKIRWYLTRNWYHINITSFFHNLDSNPSVNLLNSLDLKLCSRPIRSLNFGVFWVLDPGVNLP